MEPELNQNKRSHKKKIIASIVIIALLGGLYWYFTSDSATEYVTEKVTFGTVEEVVSVNGMVEADAKMELRFKRSGTVKKVLVEVGQEVKEGDLLIVLDGKVPQEEANQSHAALLAAEAELNLLIAGPSQEEITVSERRIGEAEASLNNLIQKLSDTKVNNQTKEETARLEVQRAETTVENTKTSYEDTLKSQEKIRESSFNDLENVYQNSRSTILSALDNVRLSLTAADNILGIDNKQVNDSFESLLSAENSGLWNQVKTEYGIVEEELTEQGLFYDSIRAKWERDDIKLLMRNIKYLLEQTKDLLDTTYEMLSASTISGNLSLTDLNAHKSNISSQQSSVINSMTSINQNQQNITSTELAYNTSIITTRETENTAKSTLDGAINNLALAKSNLQNTITQNSILERDLEREITLKEANLSQIQATHQKLIAKPRTVDRAAFEARVKQAQAAYNQSLSNLEDYQISAPVDGFITNVEAEVGENITMQESLTEDAVVMMSDKLLIKTNIPETDIAKIEVGDRVKITFDALSLDEIFWGEVSSIQPAETVVQGVVYYETTISLENQGEIIRSGMTTNLDIMTDNREDVLSISPQVLFYEGNHVFVFILDKNEKIKREIKIGIEGDENIEVIQGLSEGDNIVLYEK